MNRKSMESDSKRVAREYIDKIVAINRRHGMGDRIPRETYNRAVENAARLLRPRRSSP
jgi:hypothetical protein